MSVNRVDRGDVVVLTPKKNLLGGEETQALLAVITRRRKPFPRSWWTGDGLYSTAASASNTTCLNRNGWLRWQVGSKISNLFLVTKLVFVFGTSRRSTRRSPQKQSRRG
jgi:hypothetical protein